MIAGAIVVAMSAAVGCARTSASGTATPGDSSAASAEGTPEEVAAQAFARGSGDGPAEVATAELLTQAEAALAADEAARAVALFGRVLQRDDIPSEQVGTVWIGLAQSHEKLRDCIAAIRAYETYLSRFPDGEHAVVAQARRGACEAELSRWEESAATFHEIAEKAIADLPDQLPSVAVEALAREGYALFMLERLEQADARLAKADEIYQQAVEQETERFGNYYFIGMARFYRAAIIHRRFRDVEIRLPEKAMEASFKAKLDLLVKAQEAYNHTIKAKHMFWVSAAGYQLGHLFSELYDALMYAPVPDWLDEHQREVYFEELKEQLRPVVTKAIWVFEKNLETARRMGYENEFIERTETKLGHLQAVLLSEDASLGQPHDRLVREGDESVDAPQVEGDGTASDRKLFVPLPTPL